MSHQQLFPGFVTDDEDRQLKAAGLQDNSWGNDAVPFFGLPGDDDGNLQLGIDHPVDSEREHQGETRIFIIGPPDSPDLLWSGEDLAQAIAEFQRIAKITPEKLSSLTTHFALKWKLAPNQSAEQFVESSAGLEAVYAALDAIQKAHPELLDFNYESTTTNAGCDRCGVNDRKPGSKLCAACEPDTGLTMIAAMRLLADLGATFEHPGYISVIKDGIEYSTGDANGPFDCDYGPVDSGEMRKDAGRSLPANSTPEQLADFIRSIIPK